MAKRRRAKQKSSGGFGIFILGVLAGAIPTALWFGVIDDRPTNLGAGIDGLIEAAQQRYEHNQGEQSKSDSAGEVPEIEFSFHELLLKSDYQPPQPPPSQSDSAPQEASQASEQSDTPAPPAPVASDSAQDTSYVLQVASFADYQSADRVKASLALSGLEAFIQKVSVEGQGDFYRVRLGPYEEFDEMQRVGGVLTQLGFQALRFRLRNQS